MGEPSYWTKAVWSRWSRRRFLAAGGAASAALTLAACGGGNNGNKSTNAQASATTVTGVASSVASPAASSAAATAASPQAATVAAASPSAASAQVKRGGTLSAAVFTGEFDHQDPMLSNNSILMSRGSGLAYSRLLRTKIGPDISTLTAEVEGDLGASWEQVDPTHVTVHLVPDAKWQNIAPVNGRAVTASDVTYSYDRQRNLKLNAFAIANIDSWEAPDPMTVKLTMKQPDADGLLALAAIYNKVVAHEAVDVHGDLKNGPTIGTGPWVQTDWEPNQVIKFDKNPTYFRSGLPYADHLQLFRIKDPSTGLAAFRSKQIYMDATSVNGGLTPDDINSLKKEIPNLGTIQEKGWIGSLIFAKTDITPLSDIRVRQAISKVVDRQAVIGALNNLGFWTAGVVLPAEDYSLSDTELKQLLARDVQGAKQLLQAAGVNNWNDTMDFYNNADVQTTAQIVQANLKDLNFTMTLQPIDAVRLVKYYTASDIDIITTFRISQASANADLTGWFRSTGGQTPTHMKDPDLDSMIDAQFAEFDANKRKSILQQIQRKVIQDAALIPIYGTISITVFYPFLKNVYPGGYGQGTGWETMWLDM